MTNAKKVFVVLETKEAFTTMLATAAALGKKRIYPKDFEKLGVKEMTAEEFETFKNENETPAEEAVTAETEVEIKEENSETEAAGLDKDDILGREYPGAADSEEEEEDTPTPEELEEVVPETEDSEEEAEDTEEEEDSEPEDSEEEIDPETEPEDEFDDDVPEEAEEDSEEEEEEELISFEDIDEFVDTMKGMKGEEVIELAKELGLEWKENPNKGINRMRASMALREHFFPGVRRPSGPKSPWKKIPYSEIEKLANEHNVEYTVTEDEKINRMWAIHALNKAGITPPAKKEETVETKK